MISPLKLGATMVSMVTFEPSKKIILLEASINSTLMFSARLHILTVPFLMLRFTPKTSVIQTVFPSSTTMVCWVFEVTNSYFSSQPTAQSKPEKDFFKLSTGVEAPKLSEI